MPTRRNGVTYVNLVISVQRCTQCLEGREGGNILRRLRPINPCLQVGDIDWHFVHQHQGGKK
jgi:hypothetical protein